MALIAVPLFKAFVTRGGIPFLFHPTEYSLGYGTLQGTLQNKRSDIDNVNIYRPSLSSPEEEIYKGHHNYQEIPPGSYPNSEHARYDGRYIYDHEAPPRPPLPDETGRCQRSWCITVLIIFSSQYLVEIIIFQKFASCQLLIRHLYSSTVNSMRKTYTDSSLWSGIILHVI